MKLKGNSWKNFSVRVLLCFGITLSTQGGKMGCQTKKFGDILTGNV